METEMTQAERVRQSQLAIAKGMKVLPSNLKVLEQVQDWIAREWLYVCALDGMDINSFVENAKGKLTVMHIKKCRDDFFKAKYRGGLEKLRADVEHLQKEVKETCEESRRVRKAVTEMIFQQNNHLGEDREDITVKIHEKDAEIERLKKQINDLQKETATRSAEMQTDHEQIKESNHFALRLFRHRSTDWKRKAETKKFVEQYLQDDRFSSEQTDFLLGCMENGMSLRDIKKIAIPGVSVAVMKRLKTLF